jgi:hypothetical protein
LLCWCAENRKKCCAGVQKIEKKINCCAAFITHQDIHKAGVFWTRGVCGDGKIDLSSGEPAGQTKE